MSAEDAILAAFSALVVASAAGLAGFVRHRRRRGAGRRATLPQLVAANTLGVGLAAGLVLFGGEVYYRFVVDATDSFGLSKTHRRWMERHWRTNNVGVRDDLDYFDYVAPGKTRRLTFLGDSFTAGHGVADVERRFANLIRRERPDWEVHAIARNGNDTRHQLDTLASLLRIPYDGGRDLRLTLDPSGRIVVGVDAAGRRILGRAPSSEVVLREPPEGKVPGRLVHVADPEHRLYGGYEFDRVVWVYVLNDIVDIVPEWGRILDRVYRESQPGWLGRESYVFNTWHYRIFAARDPDVSRYYAFTADAYREDGPVWREQTERMRLVLALVTTGGGRLSVVTFPYLDRLGAGYECRPAHALLDRFWREAGVPHLDLLPLFEQAGGALTVGARDPHPNERAHRIAADAILRFLDGNPD